MCIHMCVFMCYKNWWSEVRQGQTDQMALFKAGDYIWVADFS